MGPGRDLGRCRGRDLQVAILGGPRRGRAGPGFGLERREMAAGARLEDVSARRRRAAPRRPLLPVPGARGGTAGGSRPKSVRGARCAGSGLVFAGGDPCALRAGGRPGAGGPGPRPAHVPRAVRIPELRASRDARGA